MSLSLGSTITILYFSGLAEHALLKIDSRSCSDPALAGGHHWLTNQNDHELYAARRQRHARRNIRSKQKCTQTHFPRRVTERAAAGHAHRTGAIRVRETGARGEGSS